MGPPPIAFRPWPPAVRMLLAIAVLVAGVAIRTNARLGGRGPQRASRIQPVLRVDPNTAPAPVLEALPQVGPSLANRIVAERQLRPFASLDDLRRRVRGLGPATMGKLARHLRLDRQASPDVSPDTSIAASSSGEPGLSRSRSQPSVR